ncbi:MAG: hypothetical protein ACREV2_19080, partial [Burkholderiales bacterium]
DTVVTLLGERFEFLFSHVAVEKPDSTGNHSSTAPSVLSRKFAVQKMSRIGAILCRKSSAGAQPVDDSLRV